MSLIGNHNRWFFTPSPARGVVLLTHGLNGLPASLDTLAFSLAAAGFDVLRPSFEGHRGDNAAFLSVTASAWEQDAVEFHAAAAARAAELGVPLHHVAYSMSALIFAAMPELRFSARVLLAPALALHFWYPIAMWIAALFPWIRFRSRIPDGFSANAVSGMRSATAMHFFRRRWKGVGDSTPTLVWADPRDELVSARGLRRMCSSAPAWEYRETGISGCTLPQCFHHLITGEAAVGAVEWERICRETAAFLLNRI
jgi:alpha-beta hydrolase superfamily lysophospholipase